MTVESNKKCLNIPAVVDYIIKSRSESFCAIFINRHIWVKLFRKEKVFTIVNSYLWNEFLCKLGFSNCPRVQIKTLATLVF
jgi:hypothetical protein